MLPHNSKASSPASSRFLRTDPTSATAAFPVIARDDFRTIVFADGRGFLDYQVFEDRQLVVIDELTWLGD
jgi:hypothetical protein